MLSASRTYIIEKDDYFVYPIGQYMRYIGKKVITNEHGCKSTAKRYQAVCCQNCRQNVYILKPKNYYSQRKV